MFRPLAPGVAAAAVLLVTSCGSGLNQGCCETLPPAYRAFPSFLEEPSYDAATLALTVNHYIGLGETAALADLRQRAVKIERKAYSSQSLQETRIAHVAHILWGSSGDALRGRADGAYMDLPYLSMPPAAWPYYPMVRSGQTFFVMSEFRILAGVAEPIGDYLDYCQREGRFRRSALAVPTRDQAIKDLNALQASPRWRALRWKENVGHTKYQLHADWVVNTMKQQLPPKDAAN
jgi:hypothetical protein